MHARSLAGFLFVLFVSTTVLSQESPYSGQQTRAIKSLSAGEVQGYLGAHGMGFAKVAELNHYPGPKHVLELADDLELSEPQRDATRATYERMRTTALDLGAQLVEKERELDALFQEKRADSASVQALIGEIARIQGELRFAHVEAHVAMRSILDDDQVARYDLLRGYAE